MTEPNNMKLFLSALTTSVSSYSDSSVPSSTLFFHIVENSGKTYIEAFFNDVAVPLGTCAEGAACELAGFVSWLAANIKVTDVVGTCKGTL